MKILDKQGEIVDIFGVYWNVQSQETYFFGLTSEHTGSFAYCANEVEVIEPNINFKFIYADFNNGFKGLYHWALVQDKLLDELIDGDLLVRQRFLEIVRAENIIDW